jgi:serine/threonine protein kinase
MALAPGDRLGVYEVDGLIDRGGMGEVYRAHDTRLPRTVAIKVMATSHFNDPQLRLRFEREARSIGTLSHPHICHLKDIGRQDGIDFLVMEYLEGETLAARLTRGRLPLDELLRHARQIASALADAHAHGIVHRDLKPANVMLTSAGVKLLDFGLAKLLTADPTPHDSTLAAADQPITVEGHLLGTWPYMSPEQIQGLDVDARTDLFSLGCLIYEMAAGARPFHGANHASLIAAILERDPPPLAERAPDVPAALDRLVSKCLAKRPEERWQSARDLADALEWVADDRQRAGVPLAPPRPRWMAGATVVVALIAGLAMGAGVGSRLASRESTSHAVHRYMIQPRGAARVILPQPRFILSPDGRTLVYTADTSNGIVLYALPLDQRVPRLIPGTEGAQDLAFSPDGQWIAFAGPGAVKKVSLTSGAPPVTLADGVHTLDQSIVWLPDNTIVVGVQPRYDGGGLFRVSADGGPLTRLTTPRASDGELDHHMPRAVPGGKSVLFTQHRQKSGQERFDTAVLDLATGAVTPLLADGFDARVTASGHLLFARGQALVAAPFDATRLQLAGAPVVMLDRLMIENSVGGSGATGWSARYAVADDGTLVYIAPVDRTGRRLVWVDAFGRVDPLPFEPRAFSRPRLSPDGRRIAVQIETDDRRDIWIYDLNAGTTAPLTSDGASLAPIWTPDSQRVTFSTLKAGREEVYWQGLDGSPSELLVKGALREFPGAWSRDGQTLLYVESPPSDEQQFQLLDVASRQSRRFLEDSRSVNQPQISPDGRWVAFMQQLGPGRPQVHVAALNGAARRQISSVSGYAPTWAADGRTLYYRRITAVNGVDDFVAVDVSMLPAIGKDRLAAPALAAVRGGMHHTGYDVGADGRLLVVQPSESEMAPLHFEVVLNWQEELKQRLPVRR